jgi:His-Xaa-Ser system protein HxsD
MSVIKEVSFDKSAASLDSLKKAAYRSIARFSVEFLPSESAVLCVLRFNPDTSEESATLTVEDFRKEVLDQDLRASIKTETEAVRNLILAHTFSKTGLIKDE